MKAEVCTHCGSKLRKYKSKLTLGLVDTLKIVAKEVIKRDVNDVHIKDLNLTNSQFGNFNKLRYHALIAKVKIGGEHMQGRWLVTRRGWAFLKGEAVPEYVITFRNNVVDHAENLVTIYDIDKSVYFDDITKLQWTPMQADDAINYSKVH